MSNFFSRLSMATCLIGLSAVALAGCAVPAGGYDYGAGLGVGYYQPYGYDYGGWGSGYAVGPYRAGGRGFAGGGGFHGQHAFRGAPAGRGVPSLPHGRGGGGRGGGGHGGGGAGGRR